MKGKRALLLFVLVLFLVHLAANISWMKYMESSGSAEGDLPADLTEGEINLKNGGKYRDGVVDNFDYFINPGYPTGSMLVAENTGNA
ncbi:hypothetical protein ACSAZL_16875 [Methanosarcina sp. T3]|uniref:hypothetical protein n=1 Tax=Methanosarcina sp. T3 TaxID=3439062 RepID=UPI003F828FC6